MAPKLHSSNELSRSIENQKLLPPIHDACDAHQETVLSRVRSTRYQIALMGFFGFFLTHALQINLSVALVDMVKDEESGSEDGINQNCPVESPNSSKSDDGTFEWSSSQQANILGAFYYGYLAIQIPAGYVVSKTGAKHLYGFGVLASGVFTLLTPYVAYLDVRCLIALRVLEGIMDAVTLPAFQHLTGQWAPKSELTIFSALAASGSVFGNVAIQPLVGYLCTLDSLDGWPLGFYATGVLVIIWYVAWLFLAYDSPDQHPRISESERNYIKAHSQVDQNQHDLPWEEILTSVPFWALAVAFFSTNFVHYGIMLYLPQYLSKVLNFDIEANGFLSALPWLCCFVASLLSSSLTDFLRSRRYVTTTFIRKVNQLISTILPGLLLVLAGYSGCNSTVSVTCLAIAMFFLGFQFCGCYCNSFDLAPQFVGVVFSIVNTIATTSGFLAPLVVEFVIQDNEHSEELWRRAFTVIAGVSWTGGITFLLFGSGKTQPWGVTSESLLNFENSH